MADSDGTNTSEGGTPEGGGPGTGTAGKPETGTGGDDQFKGWPEDAVKAFKEAQKEAAKHRNEAKRLSGKVSEFEAASQTELEKATKRAEDAEARIQALEESLRSTTTAQAVNAAAVRLGFVDPGDAFALIRPDIEYDDDGKAKNVDDLLKDLATRKPYLVGKRSVNGGDGGGSGTPAPGDMNGLIRGMFAGKS